MSYDRKVRQALTNILGAGETTDEDIDRAIPPLTLKAEDGRFVKVERRLWGSDQRGNQYFAYVVISEDQP